MAQSLNTKADLVMPATYFGGLDSYGQIMLGDRAFEFYSDKNVNDCIQIPWSEIDYVAASVYFGGKYIPRFMIQTREGRSYPFAARKALAVLKGMKPYVPADRLVRSLTMWQSVKQRLSKSK